MKGTGEGASRKKERGGPDATQRQDRPWAEQGHHGSSQCGHPQARITQPFHNTRNAPTKNPKSARVKAEPFTQTVLTILHSRFSPLDIEIVPSFFPFPQ